MSQPELSLIIVSFQVRELLEGCLASLARVPTFSALEIIVVDNASTDGTLPMMREKFPYVQVIRNTENVGFSFANNQGLQIAQGRYWMLLNPDTEIRSGDPDPFSLLVSFMDSHPRAGACGASLFYPDGTRQHSAFRFPTLKQVYMDLFPVHWRLRESGWNGRYPFAKYERGEPFQIDHPLGAALLVRPQAMNQVGLLDRDFFMYAEEVELCMRLKRAGWEIWCVPGARIVHHEGRSTRQFREKMFVELWRARFTLFRKRYSRPFQRGAGVLVRRGMTRAVREAREAERRGEISRPELARRIEAYAQVIGLASK